jgi:ribosome-associated protein
MKGKNSSDQFTQLRDTIVEAMNDKKAKDIVSIDLRKFTNRVAEMFILCHGTSGTQVETIANFIEESTLKKLGQKPFHREGFENKEWILLDYFDIVIHVFLEDRRSFYSIEELWGDGDTKTYN